MARRQRTSQNVVDLPSYECTPTLQEKRVHEVESKMVIHSQYSARRHLVELDDHCPDLRRQGAACYGSIAGLKHEGYFDANT